MKCNCLVACIITTVIIEQGLHCSTAEVSLLTGLYLSCALSFLSFTRTPHDAGLSLLIHPIASFYQLLHHSSRIPRFNWKSSICMNCNVRPAITYHTISVYLNCYDTSRCEYIRQLRWSTERPEPQSSRLCRVLVVQQAVSFNWLLLCDFYWNLLPSTTAIALL